MFNPMKNDLEAKTRNAKALQALMQQFKLTRGDICIILGRKPRPKGGSHGTIDNWLCYRHRMPAAELALVLARAPTYRRAEAEATQGDNSLD